MKHQQKSTKCINKGNKKKSTRTNTKKQSNHMVYFLNKNALPILPRFHFPPLRSPIHLIYTYETQIFQYIMPHNLFPTSPPSYQGMKNELFKLILTRYILRMALVSTSRAFISLEYAQQRKFSKILARSLQYNWPTQQQDCHCTRMLLNLSTLTHS